MELDVGQSILLTPGEGEVVGDSRERRVEILCDRDELCVTWTRFAPGRDGADPHVHRHHTDLFYVLGGELTVGLGADRQETAVPAGSLVIAPVLVVHAFRNASPTEELRYLNFHAPGGGFADYLRGVTPGFDSEDPPADGGRPVAEALIVPPGAGPVLVDREEIRIEVRDAPGPASNRLTCLFALEDGRLLEIQA
jgi:quercetin dioxygenase-like cupin family protein